MKKWKSLILPLALFILFCAIAAYLTSQSETLDEYAQREPEIAYKIKEETPPPKPGPQIPAQPSVQTPAQTPVHSQEKEELPMTIENPERITFQPDFYYEPLSDDIKRHIYGLSYKEDCTVPYEVLRYVRVLYIDFNDKTKVGELICNEKIAQDLVEIFYELYQADYQIEKIRLVDEYNADDNLSMQDNNTSCFNYRTVEGSSRLSKHAQGLAVDINPFFNPYVTFPGGKRHVAPVGAESYVDRSQPFAYKIDENDLCYKLFIKHGFRWGGNWNSSKDYQHFEKE